MRSTIFVSQFCFGFPGESRGSQIIVTQLIVVPVCLSVCLSAVSGATLITINSFLICQIPISLSALPTPDKFALRSSLNSKNGIFIETRSSPRYPTSRPSSSPSNSSSPSFSPSSSSSLSLSSIPNTRSISSSTCSISPSGTSTQVNYMGGESVICLAQIFDL